MLHDRALDWRDTIAGPLSAEDEAACFAELRCYALAPAEHDRAADRVARAHLSLALRLAASRAGPVFDLDQAFSAALFGLALAIRRFDPARGHRLATLAAWSMRHMISRDLGCASVVKVPEPYAYAGGVVRALARGGRRAALARLADRARRSVPVDDLPPDAAAAPGPGPPDALIEREERAAALAMLDRLPDRLRAIVSLRLGLAGEPMEFRAIGRRCGGITGERARQLYARALRTLSVAAKATAPVGCVPVPREARTP